MSGKGDNRRPQSVDEQTFAANWSRIFKTNPPRESKELNNADLATEQRCCDHPDA